MNYQETVIKMMWKLEQLQNKTKQKLKYKKTASRETHCSNDDIRLVLMAY